MAPKIRSSFHPALTPTRVSLRLRSWLLITAVGRPQPAGFGDVDCRSSISTDRLLSFEWLHLPTYMMAYHSSCYFGQGFRTVGPGPCRAHGCLDSPEDPIYKVENWTSAMTYSMALWLITVTNCITLLNDQLWTNQGYQVAKILKEEKMAATFGQVPLTGIFWCTVLGGP